ncbi:hypothetical protein FB45DRAFT_731041 [Roridomyces roridus]|uniref:Uncharacterized protein n=1 Tax=Roridomyces roridus TaxID=1738132 RepID=A0AAD7G1U7_9AGAR|nr:hypothetical protein FB45DRAFT_731041 [Roridomyces roridus]
MPTPSSSATSPSPTMAFAPSLPLPVSTTRPSNPDDRKRAVEKFKARAEISNVTRNLRARLSFASYKAVHNISHVPLRDLEAQTQSQAQMYSRTFAAKRKMSAFNLTPASYGASGSNNYYNNPATQGGGSPAANPMRRHGSMAPPPTLTFRTYYPAINAANAVPGGSGADAQRAMPAHSLFTSILAPPPSQPARTILNAADPPVPAPIRPAPSPRTTKSSRNTESTRAAKSSSRHDRPEKRKAKSRHTVDKGKQKQRRQDVDADGDVDMKAAATLTSLLLHHRPSIGSAGSPRSSIDDSETGSVHSYGGQFTQSSTRGGPPTASSSQPAPELRQGSVTPPPTQGPGQSTTPRPAPTDNEAADLMLFLATSPSPVRNKGQDQAAYRALHGGGGSRPRGRVLFPTAGSLAEPDGAPKASGSSLRGGDSFASSVSSIGGEMRGSVSRTGTPVPTETSQGQLLSPKPVYGQLPPEHPQPQQGELNFGDFVRASPSPRPSSAGGRASPNPVAVVQVPVQPVPQKANHGLRADVGRKLFEEEQMRHQQAAAAALGVPQMMMQMQATPGKARAAQEEQQRPLGAGIDLVQSS